MPDGVAKKILAHIDVFNNKYDVTAAFYAKKGIAIYKNGRFDYIDYSNIHRRYQLYQVVEKLCASHKYDFVYIRYPRSDRKFLQLLNEMKRTTGKIVTEIPTYPYNLEKPDGNYIKEMFLRLNDKVYRRKLYRYIDRIVTYSADDKIWNIDTIRTSNGISYEKNKIRKPNAHNGINLISVSHFYDCHGCDRVIKGLYQYYKSGGKRDIVFYIVGIGDILEKYRDLVKELKMEDHVLFCGFCAGSELEGLYNTADIGINSLAIHRLGLTTESTLKVREYAAKGLPIVSSYKVDVFNGSDSRYVLEVTPDDTPIDIEKLISFHDEIYNEDAHAVSETIRNASRANCDMAATLQKVIDFFEE